jgi:hypothetical protein
MHFIGGRDGQKTTDISQTRFGYAELKTPLRFARRIETKKDSDIPSRVDGSAVL